MIITEIPHFSSKIIRFQVTLKSAVEFTSALEFKISSQRFSPIVISTDVLAYIILGHSKKNTMAFSDWLKLFFCSRPYLVDFMRLHKLVMCPSLHAPSVPDHKDLLRAADGIQPVRNDKQRFSFHKLCDRLLDIALIVGIHARHRLVQNHDRRVL